MNTTAWLEHGTKLFLEGVERLPDAEFATATRLPGWTRAHVVAHVHHNAEALLRLLNWARTGERTPMYASTEQRNAEIESSARRPAGDLRERVVSSARAFSTALASMPGDAWANEVVTAQGRTVPATEVVWMRTREVAVHTIDLDTGVGFDDLPDDLNAALVVDIARHRNARGEAAALASWLTGRSSQPPALRAWL